MSAIGKPAAEAADDGLLDPELAAGISRVKTGPSSMSGVTRPGKFKNRNASPPS